MIRSAGETGAAAIALDCQPRHEVYPVLVGNRATEDLVK